MSAGGAQRRTPWADVWCKGCNRASRIGQWVVCGDRCPFCDASALDRRAWVLLRLQQPQWPLRPKAGEVYMRQAAAEDAS